MTSHEVDCVVLFEDDMKFYSEYVENTVGIYRSVLCNDDNNISSSGSAPVVVQVCDLKNPSEFSVQIKDNISSVISRLQESLT